VFIPGNSGARAWAASVRVRKRDRRHVGERDADAIQPWLVQIGRGRGGLYSFDLLDQLFGFLEPSEKILPQFQHLSARDVNPMSGGDWPVGIAGAPRSLLLGDEFPTGGAAGHGRSSSSRSMPSTPGSFHAIAHEHQLASHGGS
jgi:hypothetical protein